MRRLAHYLKRYALHYTVAVLTLVLAIVLDMFSPRLTKHIIDDVILGGNLALLDRLLLGMLSITLSRVFLGYTKEYLFDLGSTGVVRDLRKDLFDHLQTLSFSFFDGMNTGELMSRVKEDADNVWRGAGFCIMLVIEQGIYFITASVLLFTINWKLAFISLVTMPFIACITLKLEKQMGKVFEKISDQGAVLNTTAQENLAGVRLVKAFGREKYEIQKFLKQNEENYKLNVERAAIWARHFPRMEFLSNIVVVLITTVGGILVIQEEMSVGTLVAFSNYIFMLIWPMRMLGWLTNILAQCGASLKKIEKLFNEQPAVKNPEAPVSLQHIQGHVVFRDVSFGYGQDLVLKNINIDAKPGSTIAIMGTTGAGKSSVLSLIGRYYDCTSGHIYIDGVDIRKLDLYSLRNPISVVMQDTFLFSDTIEENIRLGAQDASRDDLIAAAQDARIHDFIMQLPEGYDTVIGERGIGLSGGQKQRLSIARALIRDSRILILDDATSALDMETEYELQKAIGRRKGMTRFIIAHRISAVKDADEILILEAGEIVERGTHESLLRLKGRYYDTYCEQFQGLMDIHEEEVV